RLAPRPWFLLQPVKSARRLFEKLHRDYTALWRAYDEITQGLASGDRQQLFEQTARRFYRL
ncbi:MAG: hypothetical protein AAFN78_14900, partial [Pseudomonadota bacterium]